MPARAAATGTKLRKPVVKRARVGQTGHSKQTDSQQLDKPSLGRILDNLGSSVAEVVVAPRGLDIPVGEPLIYDALEGPAIEANSIVLSVGILPVKESSVS